MIVYAPYLVVAFWGTMIFLGLRSSFMAGKGGPLVGPLRGVTQKMGALTWAAVAVLYLIVLVLARFDSETIRQMKSPFGIATSVAFIPLIAADMLLAAKLTLKDEPESDANETPKHE